MEAILLAIIGFLVYLNWALVTGIIAIGKLIGQAIAGFFKGLGELIFGKK